MITKNKLKPLSALILTVGFLLLGSVTDTVLTVSASEAETGGSTAASAKQEEEHFVLPGGMAFGARIGTKGVTVSALTKINGFSPAERAGIRVKDVITGIGGKEINTADEITSAIRSSGGKTVRFTVVRNGKEFTAEVLPEKDATGEYKAGVWIRDTTSGIGTVTYIDPQTGNFGGLGHGICDPETGGLVPLRWGSAIQVTIAGVRKGGKGTPGELKGYFGAGETGAIGSNTPAGVFGTFDEIPEGELLPVGDPGSVAPGEAEIRCTLDGNGIGTYRVELSSIAIHGNGLKNFVITVTDPELLKKTGGIVQGMSGSPVIQNGHLIGAVTHVLISDPTKGYGTFLENMLLASEAD